MHTKRYIKAYIDREMDLRRDRLILPDKHAEMYSSFGDKTKYAGVVPTGHYLSTIYKAYHATISDHLDKEVKKRGAERVSVDASYKEAKHLGCYHSESYFKALVTGTNEVRKCVFLRV